MDQEPYDLEDSMLQCDEDEGLFEGIGDELFETAAATMVVGDSSTVVADTRTSLSTPNPSPHQRTPSDTPEKASSVLPSISGPEEQSCPLCGRVLHTDNHGLNAHIDFCLSRSAIMEVQAETNRLSIAKVPVGRHKPITSKAKPKSKGELSTPKPRHSNHSTS